MRSEHQRGSRTAPLWVASVLAAALMPVALSAQDTAARVSLGFAAAPPGRQVTVPILLEGASGKKIGRLVSEVRFPATFLTFIRLERAALMDPDAFEAVAQLRDASTAASGTAAKPKAPQKPGTGILDVRISARKDETSLRDGILGYLVFQIQPTTRPEKTPEVVLAHEARIFVGNGEPATPLAVLAEGVKLVVEKPGAPVISCFFYMH